jgi:hypothetical protein
MDLFMILLFLKSGDISAFISEGTLKLQSSTNYGCPSQGRLNFFFHPP